MHRRRQSFFSSLAAPVLVVFICVGIFGLVRLRSTVTSLEYEIGRVEKQRVQALYKSKAMEAELASLTSVEQVFRRGLDLSFSVREQIVSVERDEGARLMAASYRSGGK